MKFLFSFRILVFAIITCITAPVLFGQDVNSCYQTNKVADRVWAIVESNTVNIYLIEGKDSALIIDTGYGKGDLKAYIQTLTKLPLIVVNTHGHGDHTGADNQFLKIYAHSDDFELINASLNQKVNLIPVKEGYTFDLGGRKLEVIEVPGHTHGSICLLDSDNKILFAGDNTNAIVWLFLKDCYPLEVYLKSLEKVEKLKNKYNLVMPGHNSPLQNSFISEQIACVKNILDGTCSPVPYNYSSFTAGALLCKYKTSEVAYDPNNLYLKK